MFLHNALVQVLPHIQSYVFAHDAKDVFWCGNSDEWNYGAAEHNRAPSVYFLTHFLHVGIVVHHREQVLYNEYTEARRDCSLDDLAENSNDYIYFRLVIFTKLLSENFFLCFIVCDFVHSLNLLQLFAAHNHICRNHFLTLLIIDCFSDFIIILLLRVLIFTTLLGVFVKLLLICNKSAVDAWGELSQ